MDVSRFDNEVGGGGRGRFKVIVDGVPLGFLVLSVVTFGLKSSSTTSLLKSLPGFSTMKTVCISRPAGQSLQGLTSYGAGFPHTGEHTGAIHGSSELRPPHRV